MQRGVSLIELMIGVAIAAMLFALGAPNFSAFIQNSKIRNAAEAIQNGLSLARVEAVRRNTSVQFVLGTGSSWTVGCETATTDCPASIQSRSTAEGSTNAAVATTEVAASTNVINTTPTFTDTLGFNGLGGITSVTLPAGSNAIFNITNPNGGACAVADGPMRCLRVVVTSGGQVRMCDPALTISKPTDPQAC